MTFLPLTLTKFRRDSSVGIATRYDSDGSGIESRCWRYFAHPSRPVLRPPILLYNGYRFFPRSNAAGVWRWQATTSRLDVTERVELYLYSPFWTVLAYSKLNFTFTFTFNYIECEIFSCDSGVINIKIIFYIIQSKLKKEYSYLSNPLWAFAAVSRVNFTFTFTIDYDYLYQISVEQKHPSTQSGFFMCPSFKNKRTWCQWVKQYRQSPMPLKNTHISGEF